ncbi:MAG: ABC transporter permease [Chloroflexi bacterium]|nr:ABC transporter permease [Chloroflexota bacterium]
MATGISPSQPGRQARPRRPSRRRGRFGSPLLLVPAGLVFLALLVLPLFFLVRFSLLPPAPSAPLQGPLSLASYAELADSYIVNILIRTLRIAAPVTVACLVLGYPVAISLARATGVWRTIQVILVISPLFVSVVVRAYGWLLLGNRGVVNGTLTFLGLQDRPTRFLQTEGAVVAGLAESLLPFMVLALSAVLQRQDPALVEAARGLGASPLGAFWRVTLPLSLPGALAGSLLVFMVTMGSYATPALLGGSQVRLMVTEIYTQVTSVYNWPLGAALAVVLLLVSLGIVVLASRLAGPGRIQGAS